MGGLVFSLMMLVAMVAGLALYFLPSIVANRNHHPSAVGIFVLNLLLGWSLIGWIISLVWAFSKPQPVVVVQNAPAYQPNYPQQPQAYSQHGQGHPQSYPAAGAPQQTPEYPQTTQGYYSQLPTVPPQHPSDPRA